MPVVPGLLESGQDGALWIVPQNRPLTVARYHADKVSTYPVMDLEIPAYGLHAVAGIDRETVFVGASQVGLVGFTDGQWRRYALGGVLDGSVFALVSRGRELLVGASTGLWRLNLDALSEPAVRVESVPDGAVYGLLLDGEDLWVAGGQSLGALRGDRYTSKQEFGSEFVPYAGPIRIGRDLRGGTYLGHVNRLAYVDDRGRMADLGPKNGLVGQGALDIEVDREGNTWIVGLRGVSKIVNTDIVSYNTSQGLFDNEVSAVLMLAEDDVLLGHNGGLTRLMRGRAEAIALPGGPVRGRVMGLQRASDDAAWIACTGLGIGRFSIGGGIEWSPPPAGVQLHAIVADDDMVWVATKSGLMQFRDGAYAPVRGHPLFEQPVRRLALASDGTLYCASMGNGLFCRHPDGSVQQWKAGVAAANSTFTLLVRDGEPVVVGTQAGIFEVRGDELVWSDTHGITTPTFLLSYDEQRNNTWVGTGRGVYCINPTNTRYIGPRDGLAGAEANRDAGHIDDRGYFWVGTDSGLNVIRPDVTAGAMPTVDFIDASFAGAPLALAGEVCSLDGYRGELVVRFRASSFIDEKRTLFRFRLEGLEEDWNGPRAIPDRELSYAALAAGSYRLHLQAVGADGRESQVITSPWIRVPQPFYDQLWFRVGSVLLVLIAIWGLVSHRLQRSYAQRLESQVRRRTAQLEASEHRLESDRERLTAMLTNIADGVAATDADDRIILWNKAAEQIVGRTVEQVLGQSLYEVLGVEQSILGADVAQFELEQQGEDPRVIEALSAPLANRGVVVAFRDVTARLRVDRELSRAQRLESLGMLAGGIAHDFNNYLTVVIGTLGMLREESSLTEAQRDQVSVAEQTMSRAVSLTRQLLTFSRGGAPVRQVIEIDGLLADAVTFALSGSNLRSVVDLAPDVKRAYVDPGQIAQVLHNLLLNARQAMPEGGAIELQAYNQTRAVEGDATDVQEWIVIRICDDGPGIPENLQSRIFDPFYSTREGGTGLGLAITHSIITRHGGQITVDSRLGGGTCFEILLPAVDAAQSAGVGVAPSGSTASARVLVMDDEESIRQMLGQMLRHLGHRCQAVHDGEAAVEAYVQAMSEGDPFDVGLLDLTIIGGMGGAETAHHLLQVDPHARLVAASGYSNDAVLGDYARYGFRAAIAKPFGVEQIRGVMALLLKSESTRF